MALAISGTTIAALAAMLAGAGLQYKASTDAQKRQQDEIRAGLASQKALQLKAEQRALETAATFDTPKRADEQAVIADALTQEMMAPVSESQNIRAQQQTTQGNVSGDYTTAKAASDLNSMKAAQSLARMLGKSSSANRLRMNEGIRLMDAGQDIDRLGSFSRGQAGADGVAIQQAGLVNPGMQFAGSLLQSAGSAGLMRGGGNTGITGSDLASANASADPIGSLASIKDARLANPNWADAFNTKASAFFKRMQR